MIGFKLLKDGKAQNLSEVDDMLARELYHIEPNPKLWTRSPNNYDWYNHLGYHIAASDFYGEFCTWRRIIAVMLYHCKKYSKSQEEWNEEKEFFKNEVIPIVKFFREKGFKPKCCGYIAH